MSDAEKTLETTDKAVDDELIVDDIAEQPLRKKRAAVKKKRPVFVDDDDNDDDDDDVCNDDGDYGSDDEPEAKPPARRDDVNESEIIAEPTIDDINQIKAKYTKDRRLKIPKCYGMRKFLPAGFRRVCSTYAETVAKSLGIPFKHAFDVQPPGSYPWREWVRDTIVIHEGSHSDLMSGINFNKRIEAENQAFRCVVSGSGLLETLKDTVNDPVNVVRATMAATNSSVDEAIAIVRERFEALLELAARVDLHTLRACSEIANALDGSAPLRSAVASACHYVNLQSRSWRVDLAASCDPIAMDIDDTTIALLKNQTDPVFGFNETCRIAWLACTDASDLEGVDWLVKFDALLAERGVVGRLSRHLRGMRRTLAGGPGRYKNELRDCVVVDLRELAHNAGIKLRGATRKDDIIQCIIDAAPEVMLASPLVSEEAVAHAKLDDLLRQFHHEEMREQVLKVRFAERNCPTDLRMLVLRRIAQHRGTLFDALATDAVVLGWDDCEIRSDIGKRMRDTLTDATKIVADGRTSDAIVGEAAARVNPEIADWRADHERHTAIKRARKAKLDQLLSARGFACDQHYLVVSGGEVDVRRSTAVEFTGRDPPPPVVVGIDCVVFSRRSNSDRLHWTSRSEMSALPPQEVSFDGLLEDKLLWRAQTLGYRAVLRWPSRLNQRDTDVLTELVENVDAPLRLPVELEMRVARRATLLAAIRAHGIPDKHIPMSCISYNIQGSLYTYLMKEAWPRPRALAAALVGDVQASMQRDIFAALPQLVLAIICEHLHADLNAFQALMDASEAFGRGASIWIVDRMRHE